MIDPEIEELASKADRNETTPFQINYFLIGQEPTDQAKLHKCLQEINVRLKSIKAAQREIDELSDIGQLHFIEMEKLECVIRKRMVKRKMDAISEQIISLEERMIGWESEINQLKKIYDTISERTSLKDWDDYHVQMEYWSAKLYQELKTRLTLNMPADLEVVKTILALPESSVVRQDVLQLISAKGDK